MTQPRRQTRPVAVGLSRADWAWITRELLRRHMRLNRYVAEVLEGEIAIQREERKEVRPLRYGPRIPVRAERADRPVLAVER